jgi:large exoprotein involved in heme utilization and adhesion
MIEDSRLIGGTFADVGLADSQSGDLVLNATGDITVDASRIDNAVEIGNAGDIEIIGQSLTLSDDGTLINSTFGQGNAGNITLNIDGAVDITDATIFNNVEDGAEGNGGTVTINSGSLSLQNGGQIQALVRQEDTEAQLPGGVGDAGNIIIDVDDSVSIAGISETTGLASAIFSFLGNGAIGSAGNISIKAASLGINNGGFLETSTFGTGDAGNVIIDVSDNVSLDGGNIFSQVGEGGKDNGGNIEVNTTNLSLLNGSQLTAGVFGTGDAGKVIINATDTVSFQGVGSDGSPSGVINNVTETGVGNAGDIEINTTNLTLSDGGQIGSNLEGQGNAGNIEIATESLTLASGASIGANTFNRGNAGNININAKSFSLSDGFVSSSVNTNAIGQGGKVTITTDSLTLSEGSIIATATSGKAEENQQSNAGSIEVNISNSLEATEGSFLFSVTSGEGDAGDITINGEGATISFDGVDNNEIPSSIFTSVAQGAVGQAGDILITAKSFNLTNGAQINSSTLGQGDAGMITINVDESLDISDGEIASTVELGAIGNVNGIDITTGNLNLTNGGRINASTLGQGNAGLIKINASGTVAIDGESQDGFDSGIFSAVDDTAEGNAGGIEINTANLNLTNGGVVNASTFGQGDAGRVVIEASDTISADGEGQDGFQSGIFSTVQGEREGKVTAGGIEIDTANLTLTNGGIVNASTFATGDAGLVKINANDTISINGKATSGFASGIFSGVGNRDTFAVGNAGGIEISSDNLILTEGAEIGASTFGQGDAGSINITADDISLNNGAQIAVDSQGEGQSGSLFIQADNLSLDNESSLLASTPVGTGGNIGLEIAEVLSLQGNSLINAEATGDADGGNVNINAKFVVAFPDDGDGNDIIARAEDGVGGNVNITAEQVFNLEPGEATAGNGTNDIDVSSAFGLAGQINIRTFTDDVLQGASELPENPVEPEQTVAQACSSQGIAEGENSFTVTGKGGVPPEPTDPFTADVINIEGEASVEQLQNRSSAGEENPLVNPRQQPQGILTSQGYIIPAQGIVRNKKGEIFLVGYPVDSSNQRTPVQSPNCGGK